MVDVNLNGQIYKAIFQEDATKEFLERNSLTETVILKSNDFGEKNITLRNMISSVGYSSSNLLYADINGEYTEDRDASRRVAFRILTKGEKKIEEVSEITM